VVINFKVCPRCTGDLYLTEDVFGKYASCIQCGYMKDIEEPRKVKDPMPRRGLEGERRVINLADGNRPPGFEGPRAVRRQNQQRPG
jgi:DNA-directed RNA polymerase subunit M/transcription elongation factor TFIIS